MVESKSRRKFGVCKLTGASGKFVKSHIIPRAIAPPAPGGEPFAQAGNGLRPSRRRESWYDPNLVTQEGEAILTSYDTWGIAELRRQKLIWQSWGPMTSLSTSDFIGISKDHGARSISFSDPTRMQLFLLSILWRAAASDLPAFAEISLRHSDTRRLKRYLLDAHRPPADFFPASITQLSTLGLPHNASPFAQIKDSGALGIFPPVREKIFRFYFDGMIVHFHADAEDRTVNGLGAMAVGASPLTVISTVSFEASWHRQNMAMVYADAETEFPGAIARAEGRKTNKK
jgi:hypothetical protein